MKTSVFGADMKLVRPADSDQFDCKTSLIYFAGSAAQRERHAGDIEAAGYHAVISLLQQHESLIPPQSPVLEVGPFLRPLRNTFLQSARWVIWEYDSLAASGLAKEKNTIVFQGDLNQLDHSSWQSFIESNRVQIHGNSERVAGFGAVILSSVLNYIDYKIVLKRVIDEMADGSIIFIGNSNVGDLEKMRGREPIQSTELLGFIFFNFADQIEILEGTKFTHQGMTTGRTGLKIAIRIHKRQQNLKPVDLYSIGMQLWTEYTSMPWKVSRVIQYRQSPDPDLSEKTNAAVAYWLSTDPQIVEEALRDIESDRWRGFTDPIANRQAEITSRIKWNRNLVMRTFAADIGSEDSKNLEKIFSNPNAQAFLPEREFLLDSLKYEKSVRRKLLKDNLTKLYSALKSKHQSEWLADHIPD